MQQQLWQSWAQMGNGPGTNQTMQNPMASMLQTWQQMLTDNMRMMTENATPSVQMVSEQMVNAQTTMLKMFEMTMQTWQKMQDNVGENGDWTQAIQQQTQQMRDMFLQSSADVVGTSSNMGELWQTYLQQSQNLTMPWFSAMQNAMPKLGNAMSGDTQAFTDVSTLYWDAFQQTFGQLLQAPGLGYTREFDEKQRGAFSAWLNMQQASYEYQVVLAEAWVKAFEQLLQQLVNMQQNGEEITGLRDFVTRWSTLADDIFKEIFRSGNYIEVQSRLINALMEYRVKQRAVNEEALDLLDIPTRSEIDEAHRRIYELRREVKALKRELTQLKDEPKPTRKSSSTRKKSSTKKPDTEEA